MIGIFLTIVSAFLLIIFSATQNLLSTLPIGINWIGLSLLVDFILRKKTGESFLPTTRERAKSFFKIIFASIIFCVVLEIFGMFTTRLWYYPTMSFWAYLFLAPIGFSVYTFILFGLYKLIKRGMSPIVKRGPFSNTGQKLYNILMYIELVLGVIFIAISSIKAIFIMKSFNISVIEISSSSKIVVDWWVIFLILIGVFFLFEFLCFLQGKETFSKDFLRGNLIPFVCIFAANIICIFAIEFINSPFQIWVFDNWPLAQYSLFNIPLLAYLAWPFQFPAFLSIYRYLLPEDKVDIW